MAKQPEERFASMRELADALAPAAWKPAAALSTAPVPATSTLPAAPAAESFVLTDELKTLGAVPAVRQRVAPQRRQRVGQLIAAAVFGLALLCGIVIYVATNEGTVKITLSDPSAQVEVKINGDTISLKALDEPLQLRVGKNHLKIEGPNFETVTREFTVKRGNNPVAHIELVRKSVNPKRVEEGELGKDAEWLAGATGKMQVPSPGLVAAAKTVLHNSYRAELSSAKPEDRVKLAKDLIERSSQVKEDAQQFAMLDLGRELAAEGEDLATAMNACLEIGKRFLQQDSIQLKASTLIKEADASHPTGFLDQLLPQLFTVGFEAWANDNHQTALKLAGVAKAKAKLGDWPQWTYQAAFLEDEANIGTKAWERVKNHADTLTSSPADPLANAEMGKYLCLIKNEWGKGLPMLALSDNAALRGLADKENGKPVERGAFVALADAWWDASNDAVADEQLPFRRRAKKWYLKALSLGSMDEKADLAKKAQPRIDAVPRRPIVLFIQAWGVEGGHNLDISQDGIVTTYNGHGTRAIRVNHLEWNGNVTNCQNRGVQRLYPDGLDFSTSVPLHQWLGTHGAMHFYQTSHAIGLGMTHPPGGSADFGWFVYVEECGYSLPNRFGPLWDVRYYHWDSKLPANPDDFKPADETWQQIVSRMPVDEFTASQLNFRADDPPYSNYQFRPPSAKVNVTNFAITANSTWDLPAGTYVFHGLADDGMRAFIDGEPVWENWLFRTHGKSKPIVIAGGKHEIKVDYYQMWGPMLLRFYVKRVGD